MKAAGFPWKKLYRINSSFCLCAGFLLLIKSLWLYYFPDQVGKGGNTGFVLLMIAAAYVCVLLIFWSEEKRLRLPVWGGIAIFSAASGFFWYRAGEESFFEFLPYVVTAAALVILFSVLSYLAEDRLLLRGIFIAIQLSVLLFINFRNIPAGREGVCFVLFCLLLFIAQAASKSAGTIIYLTPVFLGTIVLLAAFPIRDTPVGWKLLKDLAASVGETVDSVLLSMDYFFSGGKDSYALSFTGYNGGGGLTGSVLSDDSAQLTLTGSVTKSPLYITGTIHNTYTGNGWKQTKAKRGYDGEEYELNLRELSDAFAHSIYSEEEIQEMVRPCPFRLSFEGIKTKTFFYGSFGGKFKYPQNVKLHTSGDSITMSKPKGRGFSYTFVCLDIDWGNDKMKRLMRRQAWKSEPEPDETMEKRKAYIQEQYIGLPEELPRRVYELAAEITKGAENDYDRMSAISDWLKQFTYTTSPPICPGDADFADYFLFESQTGYCTYFATALAVLGRAVNIPTRYVEGYVTNATRRSTVSDYQVDGKNAHAWAEAYIDGIGWIPFEATPGYYEAANKAWKAPTLLKKSEAAASVDPKPERLETAEEESERENNNLAAIGGILKGTALVIVMLFFFLALTAAFLHLRSVFRKWKYRRKNERAKLEYLMKQILKIGKLSGFELQRGETLTSLCNRADGRLDTQENTLKEMTGLYQGIRFGEDEIKQELICNMERFLNDLQKKYLKSVSHMTRLIYLFRI